MSAPEDDFASNIDEQLLNSVDSHHDSRIKLEDIAHAAGVSDTTKAQQQQQKASQQQQSHQQQQQSSQQQQSQQFEQQPALKQELKRQTKRNNRASANTLPSQQQPQPQPQPPTLDEDEFRKFQLQQQAQQTSEQFVRQQQQALAAAAAAAAGLNNYGNPHSSRQQHHHHGGPQLPDLSAPSTDELAEYNIQIPDPIIDNKSKIFPVEENTITAEGNLITRPYPEQIFQSRDDLNEFIADFARDNGFGVVIAHSNKKAIYYTCELGGRYRHKKSKKIDESKQVDVGEGYMLDPDTKTKKLKCPYAMTASYKKSTGIWTLRTTCNEHNHPQLDPLSNHPMLRKRSDELNVLILDLYKLGTKPSHIESKIRESYPELIIKREDIYNEIRGYKRKLKKQNSRFGFNNPSRIANAQYRKKAAQQAAATAAAAAAAGTGSSGANGNGGVIVNGSGGSNDQADAVAAVAAAANANAFLGDGQDITSYEAFHNQQQQQQQQQNQQDQRNQQAQHLQQQQQQAQAQNQNQSQDQAQQQQQQQEEFQRQFVAATQAQQHQLDEHQYQQYQQHLQDHHHLQHPQHHHHGLNDSDGGASAAAAIAAVAAANVGVNVGEGGRQHHLQQHHHHQHPQHQHNPYSDNGDLSMDNIDSRLVGE
ncbi:hypothetical protein CORT_0D02770 [Candida orthopsilosis Co 90-125]|uniref:FAR1 domain-containing protein n=1 Tax=Candida orthopsilosis (strain 90-125) TaxID=1136231 RepID=H8X529_CANO9|nr:hypothetical protein CORT_0D02770 [Candida orthopsilosis Co 90-125]CCG23122.1 hypothetical protein CORT_0D02770 [Candida orthopsilosis Co 90-125]